MPTFRFSCILLISVIAKMAFSQETIYGDPPQSLISAALKKTGVIHKINLWEIDNITAVNKIELYLEAAEYTFVHNSKTKKGLKITLISESNDTKTATKSSSEFEAFLDKSEFPDILLVINQISNDILTKEANDQLGSMSYISNSGIKIGYQRSMNKEVGFISLMYSKAEIKAEFTNPGKFFEQLKENLEIVSQELYLPENLERMKNVKKSSQDTKDVNINDI